MTAHELARKLLEGRDLTVVAENGPYYDIQSEAVTVINTKKMVRYTDGTYGSYDEKIQGKISLPIEEVIEIL